MLLGCIADDLTGATDLALMLTRAGMRTVQVMQVPDAGSKLDGFDAVVVALKTRTCPVEEAVDRCRSRAPKHCWRSAPSSSSSSTARPSIPPIAGNIGPVAEALLAPARRRSGARVSSLPDQQAHRLHGQPVRRRRAAGGKPDEGSSADADARFQSRARAAAADQAQGRACALRCRRQGRGRHLGGIRSRRRQAASASSSSMPSPTSTSSTWAPRLPICA